MPEPTVYVVDRRLAADRIEIRFFANGDGLLRVVAAGSRATLEQFLPHDRGHACMTD